jgi:hypothetical protein
VVNINTLPIVGAKAVKVRVATSLSAPVSVKASVGIGKGKTASLTAPIQTVAPGSLAGFTLKLTPKVEKVLAALPADKSLTMPIVASATNVTGVPSTSGTTVKLRGQAAAIPKPKRHPKKK